jgi:hypothetical protein
MSENKMPQENKWLLIDSAPKDGSSILVAYPLFGGDGYGVAEANWDGIGEDEGWHISGTSWCDCVNGLIRSNHGDPTHWQPMPVFSPSDLADEPAQNDWKKSLKDARGNDIPLEAQLALKICADNGWDSDDMAVWIKAVNMARDGKVAGGK